MTEPQPAPTPHADTPHQPARPHLTATLLLGCLAQFMVILDVSVVNVALPSMKHSLDFSEAGLQWVVNAYTVTFAGFLLLGGRAADLIGRRTVFVFGLVLFALSSLAGGLADSGTVLIVARLVQGLGGAVIGPASLSILTTTFTEPHERHRAIGYWGAMGGAGGAAGVLLGGVIVQLLSWRWILFINVPIGLLGAVAAQMLLLEGRNQRATRNFDVMGAVSATAGLSLLVLGIVRTGTTGWGDVEVLVTIAAGLVLLAIFVVLEGKVAKAPLMPLRLFRSRSLSAANMVILAIGASSFAMWFFVTLFLQEVEGYSPLHTGLSFLPLTLSMVVASTLAPKITARVGPKPLLIFGMTLISTGLALFTRISVGGGYASEVLLPGVLTCAGYSLAFIPGTICATAGVAPHEAGLASGISNTARLFGGALGLAVLITLATTHANSALSHPTAAVHTAGQALVSGFDMAFWVAAAIGCFGILVAVFAMPWARSATAAEPQVAPP